MSKANQESIKYWRQHVEAYRASGLTREEYCEKNQIKVYQLDYWRKKVSRLDCSFRPLLPLVPDESLPPIPE